MKKKYVILLFVLSVAGLFSGNYLKYYRTYQTEIGVNLKTNDEASLQRQLNLSENIAFLEELDKTFAANDVERPQEDMLPKVLTRLNTINGITIGLIVLSSFLFLWSVLKLYKTRAGSGV